MLSETMICLTENIVWPAYYIIYETKLLEEWKYIKRSSQNSMKHEKICEFYQSFLKLVKTLIM